MCVYAPTRLYRLALAGLFIGTFLPFGLLRAADESVAEQTVSGELDGLDFAGTLRSADGSISLDDTLHFRGGHFWSSGCVKCSFMPGAYWTRRVGPTIEFTGVLESPERGRFTYKGSVNNGEVQVSIHWLRARWYWTMERDYAYVGRLNTAEPAGNTLQQARSRAAGEASPTCPL